MLSINRIKNTYNSRSYMIKEEFNLEEAKRLYFEENRTCLEIAKIFRI